MKTMKHPKRKTTMKAKVRRQVKDCTGVKVLAWKLFWNGQPTWQFPARHEKWARRLALVTRAEVVRVVTERFLLQNQGHVRQVHPVGILEEVKIK
jgi:hypothetical protein